MSSKQTRQRNLRCMKIKTYWRTIFLFRLPWIFLELIFQKVFALFLSSYAKQESCWYDYKDNRVRIIPTRLSNKIYQLRFSLSICLCHWICFSISLSLFGSLFSPLGLYTSFSFLSFYFKKMIIMRDATLWTCLHTPVMVVYGRVQQNEKNSLPLPTTCHYLHYNQ